MQRTLNTRLLSYMAPYDVASLIRQAQPGTANCSWFCSAKSDTMRLLMGVHLILPSASFDTIPGRTSISCPTFSTPCS
jgi:hypothetical protein